MRIRNSDSENLIVSYKDLITFKSLKPRETVPSGFVVRNNFEMSKYW